MNFYRPGQCSACGGPASEAEKPDSEDPSFVAFWGIVCSDLPLFPH